MLFQSSCIGNMAVIVRWKQRLLPIMLCFPSLFSLLYLTFTIRFSEEQKSQCNEMPVESETVDVVDENLLKKFVHPWKGDPQCENFRIEFITNRSQPLMALVSYPGSGNTWVRQLIESVTGVFTGSVYDDEAIMKKGLHGELMPAECGCTIVQKSHDFLLEKSLKKTDFNGSGILILRNPYKAIISLRHFLGDTKNHQHVVSGDKFKGAVWNSYVEWEMMNWLDLAMAWIPKIKRGGVIHYENLLSDRRNGIKTLMNLLQVDVDERRLECALRHESREFKRASKMQFDPFTKWHRQMIDAAIGEVQETLQRHGFDPMPLHLYEYYDSLV